MKKSIALLLVLAMIVCLFAACGGGEKKDEPAADIGTEAAAAPEGGAESIDVTVEEGGADGPDEGSAEAAGVSWEIPELPHAADNLAVDENGALKYEIDAKGYPLGYFEYDLPLTTSSESLVYWDPTLMPFQLVNTEGSNGPYQTELRQHTGVNIEYQAVMYTDAQQAFSVMLASKEFTDIMGLVAGAFGYWGASGGGTTSDMIDQKFFVNIADYRAYAPNFLYQIPRFDYDPELINAMWLNDTMITNMGPFIENPLPGTGLVIRGDWLDQLDGAPSATEIRTYDQVYNILQRFRDEIDQPDDGYPIFFFSTVEATPGLFFGGYNTGLASGGPGVKIVDGQVTFTLTEDVDYETLSLFLQWLDEGIIDKDFADYGTTDVAQSKFYNDGYGMTPANPTEIGGWEQFNARTSTARYDAMHTPVMYEGQKMVYGHGQGRYAYIGGGWSFATTGKNIPLAISYTDWFYSDDGSFVGSYGIEGEDYNSKNATYYFDETGEVMKTDFVVNNDAAQAIGWFMMSYQQVSFFEPIRHIHLANYAVEGGARYVQMFYLWVEDYYTPTGDGSTMDWPSASAKATDEQQKELNSFMTDTNTWFSENYALFLDRTVTLTPETWSAYVTGLYDAGYTRYRAIMQTVYDDYMAKRAEQVG